MIQMPSTVVVPGRSRMIVGSEIRTMFESSNAMNVPIVVFVSTTYLYCIPSPEEGRVRRPVFMYLRQRLWVPGRRTATNPRLPWIQSSMRPHATKGLSSHVPLRRGGSDARAALLHETQGGPQDGPVPRPERVPRPSRLPAEQRLFLRLRDGPRRRGEDRDGHVRLSELAHGGAPCRRPRDERAERGLPRPGAVRLRLRGQA